METRLRKREACIAAILLALGALLRLTGLGSFPPGLNQDEASIGYEAWALLTAGVDRCGDPWPVLFTSWGSGQNALYAYAAMPLIALLGLSPASLRLTAGIWGSLSLLCFWLLARQARGRGFGLCALALLALNPWHLSLSRWALESNLLPAVLLLGIWLVSLTEARPRLLLPAAGVLALSLYAYGTAFVFLPPFLIGVSLLLWRRRLVKPGRYLAALGLFVLLALPVSLCQLRNALGLGELRLFGMTLPALTETRQAATVRLTVLQNAADLARLLWRQSDGLPWNSLGPFGLIYGKPGLALALAGLGGLLTRRRSFAEQLLLLWLGCALLASLLIVVNVNRVNMLLLPLVWLEAEGFLLLTRQLGRLWKPAGALPSAALLAAAALLLRFYTGSYAQTLSPAFHAGLTEAVASPQARAAETLTITDTVNMPYIYVLFVDRIPPQDFADSVVYRNPDGAFRAVGSFGRYRFGGSVPPGGTGVLRPDEVGGYTILDRFGQYVLVRNDGV